MLCEARQDGGLLPFCVDEILEVSVSSERKIQLKGSWLELLEAQFELEYMQNLRDYLLQEKQAKHTVYPPGHLIFNALNSTPFELVRVVVLGQDPYHGPHQAHGLSFSVPLGVPKPPSLINIFKEIERDLQTPPPDHGSLQEWADQGVLLLNSVLTVRRAAAASHRNMGWEQFTDCVVDLLNRKREGLVFMLWGSYAQKKGGLVDPARHLVLRSTHPSPLSAHRGFLGCGHFSEANRYLQERGGTPINWRPTPHVAPATIETPLS